MSLVDSRYDKVGNDKGMSYQVDVKYIIYEIPRPHKKAMKSYVRQISVVYCEYL